jgi:hypothetical protein
MCRIATHFISTHELIQSRANAYIRCMLAGAEGTLNGRVDSQNEQLVERDQILLSSMTVPSSPREQQIGNSGEYTPGVLSRATSVERIQRNLGPRLIATPPRNATGPALFRSPSVRQEHMHTFPTSVFSMDEETLAATLAFLPEQFQGATFIARKTLPVYDASRMAQLFEFFDFDDDGIVTRDDLLLGCSNIAKNFVATDSVTQLLANAYVQRKIRRAVLAIRKHQQTTEAQQQRVQPMVSSAAPNGTDLMRKASTESLLPSQSTASLAPTSDVSTDQPSDTVKYKPGTTLVYTDEEGNNHITNVIRLSNRPTNGCDAYYIETKGVKLYVPVTRLRQLSPAEQAALERREVPPSQYQYQSQQPYSQVNHAQNGYNQQRSPHAGTMARSSSQPEDQHANGNGVHHDNSHAAPSHSANEATRSNGVKHSTPASPAVHLSVNTSTSATNLASPQQPQSSSNFAATPTAVHPEDNLGTPTHSTSSSKGGILGYLKSSIGILGIGSPKPSTVVPHTVTEPVVSDQDRCTLASNLTNTDIMSLEGGVDLNDGDSVFTNGSMFCSPTGQVQVSDGSGSTPQQQVSQHLVLLLVFCARYNSTTAPTHVR